MPSAEQVRARDRAFGISTPRSSSDNAMSQTAILSYHRRFQWWSYTASHGQLLLRSPPAVVGQTQVDVLFKNVSSVSLPTTLDDLEVVLAEGGAGVVPIIGPVGGRKLFVVRANAVAGYVVAGAVFHVEGPGSHSDPSPLLPPFPPTRQ